MFPTTLWGSATIYFAFYITSSFVPNQKLSIGTSSNLNTKSVTPNIPRIPSRGITTRTKWNSAGVRSVSLVVMEIREGG